MAFAMCQREVVSPSTKHSWRIKSPNFEISLAYTSKICLLILEHKIPYKQGPVRMTTRPRHME